MAIAELSSENNMGATARQAIALEFSGRAGEYFKIWIVNVLLSILTLGIYSAWAKVRTKRYFYGNTRLAGASFEYLAEPVQILKGRLIAFGVFVLYSIAGKLIPPLAAALGLAFLIVLPWLVVRAHAFNAHYSAYRNIRFGFAGRVGEAAVIYIGLVLLSIVTLGAAYPYYTYRRHRFTVTQSGYGTSYFGFAAQARQFYLVHLKVVGLIVAPIVVIALVATLVPRDGTAGPFLLPAVTLFGFSLIYLFAWAYLQTAIANLTWSNVSLGAHRFASTLQTSRMLWLYVSNALAVAFSLGLLIPWAQIRLARYRLHNLKLLTAGDLENFVAGEQQKVAAAGEEISDFFDVDIGL